MDQIQPERVRGVVVPVTTRTNPQLAPELAPTFAERYQVTARAVTVVPRDAIEADANRLAGAATATLEDAVLNRSSWM